MENATWMSGSSRVFAPDNFHFSEKETASTILDSKHRLKASSLPLSSRLGMGMLQGAPESGIGAAADDESQFSHMYSSWRSRASGAPDIQNSHRRASYPVEGVMLQRLASNELSQGLGIMRTISSDSAAPESTATAGPALIVYISGSACRAGSFRLEDDQNRSSNRTNESRPRSWHGTFFTRAKNLLLGKSNKNKEAVDRRGRDRHKAAENADAFTYLCPASRMIHYSHGMDANIVDMF
jgi:hypothetical protein